MTVMAHLRAGAERSPEVERFTGILHGSSCRRWAGSRAHRRPFGRDHLKWVIALLANDRAARRACGRKAAHLDLALGQRRTVEDDFVFGNVAFAEINNDVR